MQIGQLTALTHLFLYECPLKELPAQIGQLLALTELYLDGCPLKLSCVAESAAPSKKAR